MKKLFMLFAAIALIAVPAGGWVFAETVTSSDEAHGEHTVTVHDATELIKDNDQPILGAKADAPNLIRLTDNLHLGAEVSKDLHRTDADQGWAAFAKVTYTGCWFNCGE